MDDTISKYINNVMFAENLFKALRKPMTDDMLITKMLCTLPLNSCIIRAAWIHMSET